MALPGGLPDPQAYGDAEYNPTSPIGPIVQNLILIEPGFARGQDPRGWCTSMDGMESPAPAGLIEEVHEFMHSRSSLFTQRFFLRSGFGHNNRPIDEERTAKDVLSRYEAKETTVDAIRSVVAHCKIISTRHYQIGAFYVIAQR